MKSIKNFIIILLAVILSGCGYYTYHTTYEESFIPPHNDGDLTVHYLDVGQASSAVIQLPNNEILMIDAGNNDDEYFILNYLDMLNIDTVDYLVGTHPHEDHIGSLDSIINNYNVENLYMPDVYTDTASYRDVLDAIHENDINLIYAEAGTNICSSDDINIEVVAPCSLYPDDLNNSSIIIHLKYKSSSFLFTGDAEYESESEITGDVEADVLLVGHHGSSTSTSEAFLYRVDPMYAVISCGENNNYGHPHREIISILSENDITTYRTDHSGTIICQTKGGGAADYTWTMER